MKKRVLIVVGIFIAIIIISGVVFVAKKKTRVETNSEQAQQQSQDNLAQQKSEQKDADSSTFKTYRNDEYGLSLQYPQYLTLVTSADEQFTDIRFLDGGKEDSFAFSVYVSNKATVSLKEKELLNRKLQGETKYITFDNMPALETHFGGSPQYGAYDQIYLIRENKAYSFNFSTGNFSRIKGFKDKIGDSIKFD